jgi:hypothetical protein
MISYSGYWKLVHRSLVRFASGQLVSPRKLLHRNRFATIHQPPVTLSSLTPNGLFENIWRLFINWQGKLPNGFYRVEKLISGCKGKNDWIVEHQP